MKDNKKKIIVKKRIDNQPNTDDSAEQTTTNEPLTSGFKVEDAEDFEKLFEASISQEDAVTSGEIVDGKVIEVRDDLVFVDIGYKSEGSIDQSEFDEKPEVGDVVKVYVRTTEAADGSLVISKNIADQILTKQQIREAEREGTPIQGKIVKETKGGFTVLLGGGIEAFLPGSQLDINRSKNVKSYLNKWYDFVVTKVDRKAENVVVSRRKLMEVEREQKKKEFYETIKEGDEVEGPIRTILDYGIFIDLNGTHGFAHISDLSWGHIKTPRDLYKVGDIVKAKVLKIDAENDKVNLGLKQLSEDPWLIFEREHQSGDAVLGKVTKITDYGAFVEITEGVEGLLHISDLSWTKKINHPKEVLKVGDRIETRILDIDIENKKISLGLKQVIDNPWENIDYLLPIGKRVQGTVKKITSIGAFVEIEGGFEGLLHANEMDWTKKNVDPKSILKVGQTIDVIVLETKAKDQKISLGLKQLLTNPYEEFIVNNPVGSIVKGKVVRLVDFGAFVEIGNNVEGLIHISNISQKRVEKPSEVVNVGDQVNAVVVDYDLRKNKIGLSLKDYEKRLEQMEIERYVKKDEEEITGGGTLGEFFDFNQFTTPNKETKKDKKSKKNDEIKEEKPEEITAASQAQEEKIEDDTSSTAEKPKTEASAPIEENPEEDQEDIEEKTDDEAFDENEAK